MNEAPNSNDEPGQKVQIALPTLVPKVTYALLGFTVFVYLMQVLSVAIFGYAAYDLDWLIVQGGRLNSAIRAGQLWRFITPMFLHFSIEHIFFNMYSLFSVGVFIERQFGHGRFFLLYFLSAFSGNVFSFLLTGENVISAGASGAIFGLVAAEAVFFYQNRGLFGGQIRKTLGNIAFIVIINIVIGMSLGFDNWGHVGGFLGGAMFAWFAGPCWQVAGIHPDFHLEDQRESREIVSGAAIALTVFGALAAWGLFK